MDAQLWCHLPDELLERAIAMLPLPSLLRLRSVCKHWNSLISSPAFLHRQVCLPPHSYVLLVTSPFLLLFNPFSHSWHRSSLPKWKEEEDLSLTPVAVASSLVLFSFSSAKREQLMELIVWNPLSNAWKQLPSVNDYLSSWWEDQQRVGQSVLASLVVDYVRKTYRVIVVVATSCQGKQLTCVYDSSSSCWSTNAHSIFSSHNNNGEEEEEEEMIVEDMLCFDSGGVFHGGCLHAISSFPQRMMVFDLENMEWRASLVPLPFAENLINPCLLNSGGTLLLVAVVSDANNQSPLEGEISTFGEGEESPVEVDHNMGVEGYSFRIWALVESSTCPIWEEAVQMPPELFRLFFSSHDYLDGFSCALTHNTIDNTDLGVVYLSSYQGAHSLALDLSRRTWRWLPECSSQQELSLVGDVFTLEPLAGIEP